MALTREEEIGLAYGAWVTAHPVGADHGDCFIAGAQWADANPVNDWCSVKDELPKTNEDVLVDVIVAIRDKVFHEYAIAYFNKDKGQWFTVDGEAVNVVNWMPLPQIHQI
jgi:hypothetical protein